MALSASTDWTLTRDELINMALRRLRVIDPSQTTDATTLTNCGHVLNGMLKAWQVDGIDIWLTREIVVYLAYNAQTYDIGPTLWYGSAEIENTHYTTLTAAVAQSGTTLTVADITDFSDTDRVGIELDDGTLHWDVITGAPSGSTITLTTGLVSAASSGRYVFGHTFTTITRPIDVIEARVRNTNDDDQPLEVVRDRDEFMRITDKTSEGETQKVYYSPETIDGKLYVWPIAGTGNITDRLILSCKQTIMDLDSGTNNFDAPNEVLNAVAWNLADELQPEYGLNMSVISQRAAYHYGLVRQAYRQKRTVYFRP